MLDGPCAMASRVKVFFAASRSHTTSKGEKHSSQIDSGALS
jgi:hypothetical protein